MEVHSTLSPFRTNQQWDLRLSSIHRMILVIASFCRGHCLYFSTDFHEIGCWYSMHFCGKRCTSHQQYFYIHKMKIKATQGTNQEMPLWANPWVVSLGPSVYLMMDCSATLHDWENPSSLFTQTTYTSVIALFKGRGKLLHMKIRQPSKESGIGFKQWLRAKLHLQGKIWIW